MTNPKTQYVSTLMVNAGFSRAAFIRKTRPVFLAGKLCPVGGHIEPGESPEEAAAREHHEETGIYVHPDNWFPYAIIERANATVHCFFTATDDVELCRTNTAEENFEEVVVLGIKDVLVAAVTSAGTPEGTDNESTIADDLVALLGLVLRCRHNPPGRTVLSF